MIGDSVINGGALTDDRELATRIAQERLAADLERPVWVGNVSAGSWGPGNQLAYLRKFGTFDADVAIVVLSTHDIADVPDFAPDLGPDFPERPPMLALEEAVDRYLPRYVPWLARRAATAPAPKEPARCWPKGAVICVRCFEELEQRRSRTSSCCITKSGPRRRERRASLALCLRQEVEAAGVPLRRVGALPRRGRREAEHLTGTRSTSTTLASGSTPTRSSASPCARSGEPAEGCA